MRQYSYLDCKKGKILFFLFLTAMLYLSRNSLVTTSILGFNRSYLLSLALLAVAGLGFLMVNRKEWKEILTDGRMAVILTATAILLVPMLVKRDWQLMYFSVLVCVYMAVFISYFRSLKEVARCYVILLTVIGTYSVLATYLLRMLPDRGLLRVPVFYNSLDVMFHNFFISFVSDSYVKTRNFGIFREPGVYQYFITLALILNNYVVRWESQRSFWICNILLAVTMLSTMATGGVAGLGLLVLVVFFDKKLYRDRRIVCIALVLLVLLGIGLSLIIAQKGELYWELYGMVIGKFTNNDESSTERIDAVLTDLNFFLDSPVVGGRIAQVLHSVENNTTSTMLMFALFGICGGVLHVASWLALVWSRERRLWVNLCLLLITFLSFNTQNLIADTFFWLLPILALTEKLVPKLAKKE